MAMPRMVEERPRKKKLIRDLINSVRVNRQKADWYNVQANEALTELKDRREEVEELLKDTQLTLDYIDSTDTRVRR